MVTSKNWTNSKYFGQTPDEIKASWKDNGDSASRLGTAMHQDIENFYNNLEVLNPDCKEFQMFMNFWTDFQREYPDLKIFRTEWIVYDEDVRVSGSIDCVLQDSEGNLYILDWKRSKEIKFKNTFRTDNKGYSYFAEFDNCNYCHYSLQLNIYRTILELKYGRKVLSMMLVVLHPNQNAYQCVKVNFIDLEGIWPNINNF
jgi:ATP-dependent exoDNAse (exonuclease V) beta subunit